MTSVQILTILMSMSFAVAFTAVLRKLFTKADGTCPIDGKWVYVSAAVFGVLGKVLTHYATSIPPIAWEVAEPIIGVVLALGGVQAIAGKRVVPTQDSSVIKVPKIPPIVTAVGVLFLAGLCMQGAACWAATPACKVIDAAHDTCVVFNYLGPNGEKQTVMLNRDEAVEAVRTMQARRATQHQPPDAGADK